jgi:hypothetical protein
MPKLDAAGQGGCVEGAGGTGWASQRVDISATEHNAIITSGTAGGIPGTSDCNRPLVRVLQKHGKTGCGGACGLQR